MFANDIDDGRRLLLMDDAFTTTTVMSMGCSIGSRGFAQARVHVRGFFFC